MRAALLHGPRDLRVGELPDPRPAEDEVLLRVRSVGICGSDLHHYREGAIGPTASAEPFALGHEFAAEVVEGGTLPTGTLVAVDPSRPCGSCEWCLAGHRNLCPHVRFTGVPPRHGALAEYVTARPEELVPVPEGFDATTAALLEPLGVAVHALDLARLRPLDTVAVVGAGPIGLLILQVARVAGAGEIVVVDPVEHRAAAALALGADAAVTSGAEAREHLGARGADVVLEATDSPEGPESAAELVRIGGRVILVGIPRGDAFTLTASLVRRKGLTIKLARRMGDVYGRSIQLVRAGRVRLAPLVTHEFGLADVGEAFAMQDTRSDGVIKCVVRPRG